MTKIPSDHFDMWVDNPCAVHLMTPIRPRRLVHLGKPETVTAPRPAWHENDDAWARRALCELHCGERVNLNGHMIERTDAFSRLTFHVDNTRTRAGALIRYTLAQALAKVCEGGEHG